MCRTSFARAGSLLWIGWLFLLYGFYRGIGRPGISVILTVVSLGTRVILAYLLSPVIGEVGIWMAVPIGWFLADAIGYGWYFSVFQNAVIMSLWIKNQIEITV